MASIGKKLTQEGPPPKLPPSPFTVEKEADTPPLPKRQRHEPPNPFNSTGTTSTTPAATTETTTSGAATTAVSKKKRADKDKSKGKGKGKALKGKGHRSEKDDKKWRLMEINREIAEYGQRKLLGEAVRVFDGLAAKGITPTLHTYTALLNAFVRKGDLEGAKNLFGKMEKEGLKPNTVTYTTLLKGACSLPDMREACAILDSMQEQGVEINLRTLNTFLRGCLRVGDLEEALKAYQAFVGAQPEPGLKKVAVDASAREAVLRLLTSALRFEDAMEVVTSSRVKDSDPATHAAAWLLMAESMALRGKTKSAGRALEHAKKSLSKAPSQPRKGMSEANRDDLGSAGASVSVEMFLQHRRQEVELELADLESLLQSETNLQLARSSLAANLAHFIYLRPGAFDPKVTPKKVANELDFVGGQGLDAEERSKVKGWVRKRALDGQGTLNVAGLLENMPGGPAAPATEKPRTVRIEVCSGNGDWVVEQAAASQATADWVALELRHDRCVQISRKATKKGLRNLLVVGGDAGQIMPQQFPKQLASHIYVNFPEPPAWHERNSEVEANHLLTKPFLRSLGKILKPKGRLIIVSDNQSYIERLQKDLKKMEDLFEEAEADAAHARSFDGREKRRAEKEAQAKAKAKAERWELVDDGSTIVPYKRKRPRNEDSSSDSSDSADDAFVGGKRPKEKRTPWCSIQPTQKMLMKEEERERRRKLKEFQQYNEALAVHAGLPEQSEENGLDTPFGESYFHRLWARGRKKQRRFHLSVTRRVLEEKDAASAPAPAPAPAPTPPKKVLRKKKKASGTVDTAGKPPKAKKQKTA